MQSSAQIASKAVQIVALTLQRNKTLRWLQFDDEAHAANHPRKIFLLGCVAPPLRANRQSRGNLIPKLLSHIIWRYLSPHSSSNLWTDFELVLLAFQRFEPHRSPPTSDSQMKCDCWLFMRDEIRDPCGLCVWILFVGERYGSGETTSSHFIKLDVSKHPVSPAELTN